MYLRLDEGILLKKGVATVASMASKAILHFGPHGLSLKASEPNSNIMVVLRIDFSCFNIFSCDEHKCVEINLQDLDSVLDSVGEGHVSISTQNLDGQRQLLDFMFNVHLEGQLHPQPYGNIQQTMIVNEASDQSWIVDDWVYESKSSVAITTVWFRDLLMHFSFFGKSVHGSITHNQVKFSTVNQDIVLTEEREECIIKNVARNERIQFSIDLEHTRAAFLNASVLSPAVCIYTPALLFSPYMLDFPVGKLVNIKFFCPRR